MSNSPRYSTPLTNRQLADIAYACHHPRLSRWSAPPLTPGKWRELNPELAATTLASASVALQREMIDREPFALRFMADRVRMTVLPCWAETALLEVQGFARKGRPGIMGLLVSAAGIWLLDGTSIPIHRAKAAMPLILDTPDQRMSYVQLFMNWVRGENGRFMPVGDAAALAARLTDPEAAQEWAPKLMPLVEGAIDASTLNSYSFTGVIMYADGLFSVKINLHQNGDVKMADDIPFATDLPVRWEKHFGPLLVETTSKPQGTDDHGF